MKSFGFWGVLTVVFTSVLGGCVAETEPLSDIDEETAEAEQASCGPHQDYKTTGYETAYECRMDDFAGLNELWRVEYYVEVKYEFFCTDDGRVLTWANPPTTRTEIYASNTHNTSSCPQ